MFTRLRPLHTFLLPLQFPFFEISEGAMIFVAATFSSLGRREKLIDAVVLLLCMFVFTGLPKFNRDLPIDIRN